jgi:dihydroorotate dehydrogenase
MSAIFQKLIRPLMFQLDAEVAHEIGINVLRIGLGNGLLQKTFGKRAAESFGPVERFGLKFANPLGIAAGFDKNGVVVNQLSYLGFGFVETGTVTLRPQPGNDKPRLFRLPDDGALLNRLGFNNDGAEAIAARLQRLKRKCVVGVNIGRNKDVPNEQAVENYLATFDLIHPVADYVTVNVSSPNTPGLRDLQRSENIEELLSALQNRNRASGQLPLLVKIAPDLSEADVESIVEICIRLEMSGIIATNTTVSRDGLKTPDVGSLGPGGVSGRPIRRRSTEVIRTIHRHSKGKLPIIGVGGIFTAEDAFDKIAAGACLLQAYTGFIYSGPGYAAEINEGLKAILGRRGFKNLDDAVGCEAGI